MNTDFWPKPLEIAENNFKFKSLSNWSCNIAIGCEHACRFCYVPEVSTNRMATRLAKHGVQDPDAEWGDYVFLRKWDPKHFLSTLNAAERTPLEKLKPDSNRAVMLCTTTDAYMTIRNPDREKQGALAAHRAMMVGEALRHILHFSTLNVRILTRSPLARQDFDLMKQFGNRLLFGMSLPTLNNKLAKVYEPKAPAPSQRLETLRAAKAAGIPIYVAVAPVYPDCDAADMNATLRAIRELDPVTIFMEPINIRADNVARIAANAKEQGVILRTDVFSTPEKWRDYAINQMLDFERIALSLDIDKEVIHLWPDASLGSQAALKHFGDRQCGSFYSVLAWLNSHWNKTSAWPVIY